MIEADVSLGTVTKGKVGCIQPIMAHPPIKSSDISLEEFLDAILDYHTPKGIKLDIKDNNVFKQTLNIIKHRESKVIFYMKIIFSNRLLNVSNKRSNYLILTNI